MAPVRRYLRISKHSILEVRVYLDNPADVHRWLLRQPTPALPRVIEAVRPLIVPKLKEENDRARKGGKKKGIKDVVVEDDFDVSIFLTELSSPHSILKRHKTFQDKDAGLTDSWNPSSGAKDDTIDMTIIREEDSDEQIDLSDIPEAPKDGMSAENPTFVNDEEMSDGEGGMSRTNADRGGDDKKKLGFQPSYEGFTIYGRILCLVVKRKGKSKPSRGTTEMQGQANMEDWIASTQVERRNVDD